MLRILFVSSPLCLFIYEPVCVLLCVSVCALLIFVGVIAIFPLLLELFVIFLLSAGSHGPHPIPFQQHPQRNDLRSFVYEIKITPMRCIGWQGGGEGGATWTWDLHLAADEYTNILVYICTVSMYVFAFCFSLFIFYLVSFFLFPKWSPRGQWNSASALQL